MGVFPPHTRIRDQKNPPQMGLTLFVTELFYFFIHGKVCEKKVVGERVFINNCISRWVYFRKSEFIFHPRCTQHLQSPIHKYCLRNDIIVQNLLVQFLPILIQVMYTFFKSSRTHFVTWGCKIKNKFR